MVCLLHSACATTTTCTHLFWWMDGGGERGVQRKPFALGVEAEGRWIRVQMVGNEQAPTVHVVAFNREGPGPPNSPTGPDANSKGGWFRDSADPSRPHMPSGMQADKAYIPILELPKRQEPPDRIRCQHRPSPSIFHKSKATTKLVFGIILPCISKKYCKNKQRMHTP